MKDDDLTGRQVLGLMLVFIAVTVIALACLP